MSFGMILATISLLIGTVFFLYSLRYYIVLALVLGFSRQGGKNGKNGPSNGLPQPGSGQVGVKNGNGYKNGYQNGFNGNGKIIGQRSGLYKGNGSSTELGVNNGYHNGNVNGKGIFYSLFRHLSDLKNGNGNGNGYHNGNGFLNGNGNGNGLGMLSELKNLPTDYQPFISIHLPFYNEKKVANRVLTACTTMDYQNYEVVVVDDSNDETVEILKKWMEHPRVKIIHRAQRTGFKGGALGEALKHTDPRTEFIVVFDADFIPYPDTLWQFLKYFQLAAERQLGQAGEILKTREYQRSNIAAIQGYQWHVLNKNENWITRSVRAEFAGSYVVERPGTEIIGALKQIAGSVYMIRTDVLKKYGWGHSITEDFELTLKLYRDGYKVVYTPYIQAPSECVSTIKRLIRQRMRWAEGHTYNIKRMFLQLWRSPHVKKREKIELLYLSPYYLQATLFLAGTLAWFVSDAILRTPLPFWTALWGWSLVLTNLFALPLINGVGIFLEEGENRDFWGIFSFILLTYVLVPFQAYAAFKGLIEKDEGNWFRTPKSGRITDTFYRSHFRRWFRTLFPGVVTVRSEERIEKPEYLRNQTSGRTFDNFQILPSKSRLIGNLALAGVIFSTILFLVLAPTLPTNNLGQMKERKFGSLTNAKAAEEPPPVSDYTEITGPLNQSFGLADQGGIEYIFHPEPRVRTKLAKKEVELTILSAEGLGKASPKKTFRQNGIYTYEEIFPDINLEYIPENGKLTENFILRSYQDFDYIAEKINTVDLELTLLENQIYFSPSEGGQWILSYIAPYLYEKNNPEQKTTGIQYKLEKDTLGWTLKKVLTEEGKKWLSEPNRVFPVVLDPTQVTSVIEGSKSATETNYPSVQRKIAYSTRGGGTDGWYAVYLEGTGDSYIERCLVDTNCDANGDWTNLSGASGTGTEIDTVDSDNSGPPSVWLEGTTLWIAWFDNSADSVQFTSLDTTNDTLSGTICTMPDNGNVTVAQVSIAVADDGDIFVAQNELGTVYKSTSACSTTDLRTGSGFTDNDEVDMVTKGNDLWMVFQDDANLSLSIYVDDASPAWDTSNQTINANTETDFSIATDGTDFWIIQATTTSGADFFSCTSTNLCNTDVTNPSWTTQTDPFSGLSAGSDISVGFITTGSILVASIIDGSGSGEQVKFRTSTDNGANWNATTYTYGFLAGASGLDNLSSTMLVTNDTEFAATVLETTNSEFEFSTLPERSIFLLIILPALPWLLNKLKKRSLRWKTI